MKRHGLAGHWPLGAGSQAKWDVIDADRGGGQTIYHVSPRVFRSEWSSRSEIGHVTNVTDVKVQVKKKKMHLVM